MLEMPQNLKRRLNDFYNAAERKRVADEERQEVKKLEDRALYELRQARFDEMMVSAKEISEWLLDFYATEECCDLLKFRRVIQIFAADFRAGRPVPASSTECTTIELRYNRRMMRAYLYRLEWHKGERIEDDNLGHLPLTDPTNLAVVFHPDFLTQWAAEIKSGKIWDNIERSLR